MKSWKSFHKFTEVGQQWHYAKQFHMSIWRGSWEWSTAHRQTSFLNTHRMTTHQAERVPQAQTGLFCLVTNRCFPKLGKAKKPPPAHIADSGPSASTLFPLSPVQDKLGTKKARKQMRKDSNTLQETLEVPRCLFLMFNWLGEEQ